MNLQLTPRQDDVTELRSERALSKRPHPAREGKVGWALLWLLGIPLPVLLVAYLIMGH